MSTRGYLGVNPTLLENLKKLTFLLNNGCQAAYFFLFIPPPPGRKNRAHVCVEIQSYWSVKTKQMLSQKIMDVVHLFALPLTLVLALNKKSIFFTVHILYVIGKRKVLRI